MSYWSHIGSPVNNALSGNGTWVKLGKTTLGSSGDSISVGGLNSKTPFYMVLTHTIATGGAINQEMTFNSDTATNYSWRHTENGAADVTGTNVALMDMTVTNYASTGYSITYIYNDTTHEKTTRFMNSEVNAIGDATVPNRTNGAGKWDNVVDGINEITISNSAAGSYDTDTEMVVLGWNPVTPRSSNLDFWQFLGSTNLGGTASSISVSSLPLRKYLFGLCYLRPSSTINSLMRVGNSTVDTATNYAYRTFEDDTTETSNATQNQIQPQASHTSTQGQFMGFWMINKSDREKLIYIFNGRDGGSGELVSTRLCITGGKWDNTSSQVDVIELREDQAGDYNTNSTLTVWGHD